jgi:3-deoxy-D-manno-octulosonic-acid transferase
MTRFLYNVVLVIGLPVILLRLVWRSLRDGNYLKQVGERFGAYGSGRGSSPVWIHAVSVGEARAAQPLVNALLKRDPAMLILITYMTPTGRATGESLFADRAMHAYLPYDYPWAVRRFLDHFTPRLGLIMETELWPNLIRLCKERGMPTGLVNGRMSEKSARGYAKLRSLTAETLGSLGFVSAQSEADAARLTELGARDVRVCGNLKFDAEIDEKLVALGAAWHDRLALRRRVLLAASTREDEERLILDAWLSISEEHRKRVLLVIVPRHPQRFGDVALLLQRAGLRFARRSEAESGQSLLPGDLDAWLGDSMGEMPAYYALADVALIGGSLQPFGAQNLIEACALGKPVVLGPSSFNFAEVTRWALESGAARQVGDARAALRASFDWLNDDALRLAAGEAGRQFAAAHRGATEKNMALIVPYLAP